MSCDGRVRREPAGGWRQGWLRFSVLAMEESVSAMRVVLAVPAKASRKPCICGLNSAAWLGMGEAVDPIEKRGEVAGHLDLIQKRILRLRRKVRTQHRHDQADKGVEAEAGGDLEFAVPPADGQQLAASGERRNNRTLRIEVVCPRRIRRCHAAENCRTQDDGERPDGRAKGQNEAANDQE